MNIFKPLRFLALLTLLASVLAGQPLPAPTPQPGVGLGPDAQDQEIDRKIADFARRHNLKTGRDDLGRLICLDQAGNALPIPLAVILGQAPFPPPGFAGPSQAFPGAPPHFSPAGPPGSPPVSGVSPRELEASIFAYARQHHLKTTHDDQGRLVCLAADGKVTPMEVILREMPPEQFCLPSVTLPEKPAEPQTARIVVDCAQSRGKFDHHLFGTIAGPFFDQTCFDLTKEAGFKLLEIFFMGTAKIPADIDEPTHYDFALVDQQIDAAFKIGVEPVVMLGFPSQKPKNLQKFSHHIQNVVKHLTGSWANGRSWPLKILRIGNEPDNREFFQGSPEEFFETYGVFAKAILAVTPDMLLLGPGFMRIRAGVDDYRETVLNDWVTGFLSYCDQNKVPVDFFSYHAYAPIPFFHFAEEAKVLNAKLQEYPHLSPTFGTPRLANDEWLIMLGDVWRGSYNKSFDTAFAAAMNINNLINMIEQGLRLSFPMTGTFNGSGRGNHDFPLVGEGPDGKAVKKPSFFAFQGFNHLCGMTRIPASGTDQMNLAVIAGKNDRELFIVCSISDFEAYLSRFSQEKSTGIITPPVEGAQYAAYAKRHGRPRRYDRFEVSVSNLPWQVDNVQVEHFVVDDERHFVPVKIQIKPSNDNGLTIFGNTQAPAIHFLKVSPKEPTK